MTLELSALLQLQNFRVAGEMLESEFRYRVMAPLSFLDNVRKPKVESVYHFRPKKFSNVNQAVLYSMKSSNDQTSAFDVQIKFEKTCLLKLFKTFDSSTLQRLIL
jgi:hypothetical protein